MPMSADSSNLGRHPPTEAGAHRVDHSSQEWRGDSKPEQHEQNHAAKPYAEDHRLAGAVQMVR